MFRTNVPRERTRCFTSPEDELIEMPASISHRLTKSAYRICGVLLVVGICSGFLLAIWLSPNPAGLGTHQQLGLPPCTTRLLLGIRCPACGMTTSWANLFEGNLFAAAAASCSGVMLAGVAVACLPVGTEMVRRGQIPRNRTLRQLTFALIGVATVAIVEWACRVFLAV
jgi:hypothetical protein